MPQLDANLKHAGRNPKKTIQEEIHKEILHAGRNLKRNPKKK